MHIALAILRLLGSLGLFLYGMRVMSEGLKRAAGERLQAVLSFMTGNRFAAVFSGLALTVLLQSSSASTVMIVGFVNAGLLAMYQALGMVLGANIGTTLTGWLVAFFGFRIDISAAALPAIAVGATLLFIRKLRNEEIGEALIGFGLLFLGLMFLSDSVPSAEEFPEILVFAQWLTGYGVLSTLAFVLVGGLLTVVLQSSSAAVTVTLTMAFAGWIDYPMAAAIILGENIGTTVTANLASIGGSDAARRAARGHFVFNVVGVLWMIPLFLPFLALVERIVPGDPVGVMLPTHLAVFHTAFNVLNVFLFLPFLRRFASLIERFVRPADVSQRMVSVLQYVQDYMRISPELYLLPIRQELGRMASQVVDMYRQTRRLLEDPSGADRNSIDNAIEAENLSDQTHGEITGFLASCSTEHLSVATADAVVSLMRISHELERIADSCLNLAYLAERAKKYEMKFGKKGQRELLAYLDLVDGFLTFAARHVNDRLSETDFSHADEMERVVNTSRAQLKKRARKRLQKGADVRTELLMVDVANHLEHIGDFCLNIVHANKAIRASGFGSSVPPENEETGQEQTATDLQ